jgi:YidC/Oxa1 family membrane protein insertase
VGELFGPIGYIFNLIFTFPIFNALMLLDYLFGDFALAIIVLTVIIRLILVPLTLQSLKSTKAMQKLQKPIADIRKKYANDQQKLLEETQKLYKEAGVNPVAGCLPMLIQMPVLYGLYFAIGDLVRTTAIKNGVLPDGYYHTINSLLYPFIPHFTQNPNLNLDWFTFMNPAWHMSLIQPQPGLAILAGVATFIQLRMSQPQKAANGAASGASDPTAQSMKMMQYFMPVMIAIFGWSVAAGLALYWTVSSVFQAIQQYFVSGFGSLGDLIPALNSIAPAKSNAQEKKSSTAVVDSTIEERREQTAERRTNGASSSNGERAERTERRPVSSQARTTSRSSKSASQSSKRPRSTSASARRRSSAQKSRG